MLAVVVKLQEIEGFPRNKRTSNSEDSGLWVLMIGKAGWVSQLQRSIASPKSKVGGLAEALSGRVTTGPLYQAGGGIDKAARCSYPTISTLFPPCTSPSSAQLKSYHKSKSIMLPTTIRSPPAEADYTPLAEYQSQTPESFTDGKPILHYHLAGAKATIPRSQCGSLAVFPQDTAAAPNNSTEGEAAEELAEQTIDVFATSECVLHPCLSECFVWLLTCSQKLHHLQPPSRSRCLDPLPFHLYSRSQNSRELASRLDAAGPR